MLAFLGFAVFVVLRLQQGFERRAAEWFGSADEVPVEREEVVSTEVEFTRYDEQGRLVLHGRAEEALGRSDGQQRFRNVEVRLVGVYADGDAVVAADELLLDPRTEAVEFIGNALLSVEGLELSGPHLHFRRSPDRLWSRDPVQFQSSDFIGIAASMQFETLAGDVSLQGVVAAPVTEGGLAVVAERVRFDGQTADTTLFGDVEIESDRLQLFSQESVTAHRDRERRRMRSIEAGFGTALTFRKSPDEAAPGASGDELVLRGDELEITLEEGRTPRRVLVKENLSFRRGAGTELRADEGTLTLDPGGDPEWLTMTGEVTSRLPAGPEQRQLISVDSSALEVDLGPQGLIREAAFEGGVEARYGRASATAETARWDGSDILVLEGDPRVVDSSLLELEGGDLRLVVAEPSRIEAREGLTARFLPARLDWLPGQFDGVVLTADTALLETGSGLGDFRGGVRLLFGKNRLLADEIKVDAEGRTLEASGDVATSLELDIPPGGSDPVEGDSAASPFVFAARSERFHYEAEGGRIAYTGSPELEREESSGEHSKLFAGRIEAEMTPEGSLGAVVGFQGARFERGSSLVRGFRIRYEPAADILLARGSPAVLEVDGRTSEGGLLELALGADRTEIHPTRSRRAFTRGRVTRGEIPSRR